MFKFWDFKSEKQNEGLVGIHITQTGIAMAYVLSESATIPHIQGQKYQNSTDFATVLGDFVKTNDLNHATANYVIPSPEITLTLVDTPNVPREEMNNAMQWLVREIINYPITEAVLDSFEVPIARARDNTRMSYVAIMRKILIPKIETLVKSSGLTLKYIDIPELVLRNIACLHPEEPKGILFVYLTPTGGKLILCKEGKVYIARSIELKLDSLKNDVFESNEAKMTIEQLSLEIQRSLDYSASLFRLSIANSLLLAPTVLNPTLIQENLKSALGLNVNILDLNEVLSFETSPDFIEQANCLLAIASVLRNREKK